MEISDFKIQTKNAKQNSLRLMCFRVYLFYAQCFYKNQFEIFLIFL